MIILVYFYLVWKQLHLKQIVWHGDAL